MKLGRDIKYLNREFSDLTQTLKEFAKSYFPDTYNDFSPESLGNMFIEMDAYVGDILSFYLDNQIQENFPQYARVIENLYKHAYSRGYKPKVTTPSVVEIDIYQEVPAIEVGGEYVPNLSAALLIPSNTIVRSEEDNNQTFLIEESVDFSFEGPFDPTESIISQVDGSNNPTYFLLKKTRKAISASIEEETFTFGSDTPRFPHVTINNERIIKILSVKDSDENTWWEVDNLGQDLIYVKTLNTNPSDNDVKTILTTQRVKRRFISRFIDPLNLRLEFGSGNYNDYDTDDTNIIPNPSNTSVLGQAYDPLNFLFTKSYGIVPKNTTLTVKYLVGGGIKSNVPQNVLTLIDKTNVTFVDPSYVDQTLGEVTNTLTTLNPSSGSGGSDGETIEELRLNILNHYSTQLRTVTEQDYLVRTLTLPSEFGSISKSYIVPSKITENQESKNLNLYVLGYNNQKQLKEVSQTLKDNLVNYLYEYKSLGDEITIKNGKIINIGVNFSVLVRPNYNTNEVLSKCIDSLTTYFNIDNWNINQPIVLDEIYLLLDKVEGVQTVHDVTIENKIGSGEEDDYSNYSYDLISSNINNIIYPSLTPMIFEVKFPSVDIKGKSITL